mmetsp:Transcript_70580/g.159656  ORF Transcript_70580/g.159656 Transcript_70580/m.159656 type:complete len:253 (-) Transcript_70580:443-1201(-)
MRLCILRRWVSPSRTRRSRSASVSRHCFLVAPISVLSSMFSRSRSFIRPLSLSFSPARSAASAADSAAAADASLASRCAASNSAVKVVLRRSSASSSAAKDSAEVGVDEQPAAAAKPSAAARAAAPRASSVAAPASPLGARGPGSDSSAFGGSGGLAASSALWWFAAPRTGLRSIGPRPRPRRRPKKPTRRPPLLVPTSLSLGSVSVSLWPSPPQRCWTFFICLWTRSSPRWSTRFSASTRSHISLYSLADV